MHVDAKAAEALDPERRVRNASLLVRRPRVTGKERRGDLVDVRAR
jgi:hypothetical protein